MLSFRLKKQTSTNVADTTFKLNKKRKSCQNLGGYKKIRAGQEGRFGIASKKEASRERGLSK